MECEAHTKRGSGKKEKALELWVCVYMQACEYCICTNSRCLPSSPLDNYKSVQDQAFHGSKAPSAFTIQPDVQENARIINLLSEALVSPLQRSEALLLRCKTSFSQADKERWQTLSNLPSSANLKSPPDHCFSSLTLPLTLSAHSYHSVYSPPSPSLVST